MTRAELVLWLACLAVLVWAVPQVLRGIHAATHINVEAH